MEDDGDGIGHFGGDDVVEADDKLAARRFLGDEGHRLQFSPAAIEKLRKINAGLKLELYHFRASTRRFAAEAHSAGMCAAVGATRR